MRLRTLFFATLLVGACDSGTDPEDQLRLHVTVEPAVVTARAPVIVTVTIVNVSARSVSIPPYECPQRFEVRTLEGDIVGPEPRACTAEGRPPTVLAPEEEWRVSYQWSGGGLGGEQPFGIPLPPGAYRVHAVLYPLCPTCVQKRSEAVPVVVQ